MLRAELYNYSGEVNKIQKSLGSAIYSVPFTFLDNYDLQTPHIVLTLAGEDANGTTMQAYMAFQINYIVIYDSDNAAFRKQYYFVDKVIWQTNELLEFALRKDVLMTYATSIVNLEGLLERAETTALQTLDVEDKYVPFDKDYSMSVTIVDDSTFNGHLADPAMVITTIQTSWNIDDNFSTWNSQENIDTISGLSGSNSWEEFWPPEGCGYGYNCWPSLIVPAQSDFDAFVNCLKIICGLCIENNFSFASYILGLWILPFSANTANMQPYDNNNLQGTIPINDSWRDLHTQGDYPTANIETYPLIECNESIKNYSNMTKHIVSNVIYRMYDDFRDFKPYTRLYMQIPFYGDYEFDPALVYGKRIGLKYIFNFIEGTTKCFVYILNANNTDSPLLLDCLTVNALIQIPLNTTNAEQVAAQSGSNVLKLISSTLMSLMSGIGAAFTPFAGAGIANAIGMGAAGFENFLAAEETNIEQGLKAGSANSDRAYVGQNQVYICKLKWFRSNVPFNPDHEVFEHHIGRPAYRPAPVSSHNSGAFMKYESIHADIPYATSQEKEEIERLLMSGVYK